MVNSNIIRSWNGRTIRQRNDGYLSATDMCQACDKLFKDFEKTNNTQEYLKRLADKLGFSIRKSVTVDIITKDNYPSQQGYLIEIIPSSFSVDSMEQGTWVHRKVAIRLAQWLSPDFAIQVDEWVEDLLIAGKVELNKEPLPTTLPPADIRVTNLIGSLTALGIELTNPRIKQGLQDLTLDLLGITTKSLPSAVPIDIWTGVAERAEELGYAPGLVVQYRSQLGKYVKSFSLESKQEKRLCNGTQRPINIYKVSDELDSAIKEFMDAKVLAS